MSERPFDVVVLSSVEWDAAWQRHQAFAAQWARAGHRVFFVENTGFREPGWSDLGRVASRLYRALRGGGRSRAHAPEGLSVLSPLVLPPTRRVFQAANESALIPRLIATLRTRGLRPGAVVFAYLPTATTLALLDRLAPSLVVYDCVDNFYGLPSPPPDLARTEAALMARAGLVLTTSRTLFADKKGLHANVVELHHGVGPAFFLPPRPARPVKRLCYFGTVWRALDYEPLRALAEAGFEVELVGPVKEAPPSLPPSIRLSGPVPHDELPARLSAFDALLLPYADDEYNRGVIPAKTYECLATGLPVLASPLPALAGLADVLTLCRAPGEWVAAARATGGEPESARQARVKTAREHAEESVFERLRGLVASARAKASAAGEFAPNRGTLLSGLGWIGVLYTVARASTLFTQMLAGRLLGPKEYGLANLVFAAASYLQIVPMLGFPLATSKLIADEEDAERRARLVTTSLAAFAVWAALSLPLVVAARLPIERALGLSPELFVLAALLAAGTAVSQVIGGPLLGLKRFADRGFVEIVYGFAAPVLLLAAVAVIGADHRAMILAFVGSLLASSLCALWALRRELRPSFEFGFVKDVGRYAATATLILLSTACLQAPARLILNGAGRAADAGVFSAYFTTTVQVAFAFLAMLQSVLVPMASGPAGQRDIWPLFRRRVLPATAAAGVFFLATATAGLALFGRRYPFDPNCAALFALAAALSLAHGTVYSLYAARDYSGLRASVTGALLAGLVNVALSTSLIPLHGVRGAGLALVLSFAAGLAFYGLYALWERRRA